MNIKHIIAAVALMAMPHYAAAQQKDTTIVVGNRPALSTARTSSRST